MARRSFYLDDPRFICMSQPCGKSISNLRAAHGLTAVRDTSAGYEAPLLPPSVRAGAESVSAFLFFFFLQRQRSSLAKEGRRKLAALKSLCGFYSISPLLAKTCTQDHKKKNNKKTNGPLMLMLKTTTLQVLARTSRLQVQIFTPLGQKKK